MNRQITAMLLGLACICALATGGPLQAKDLYVGKMKANKILFLGNSITLTKHDAIWRLDCGVAASAPERDFAHLVTRYIAEANGGRAPEMKAENFWYVGQYEQRYANYDPEVSLRAHLDWQPDILVLAIGENIENLDTPAKQAAFAKSFRAILTAFKNKSHPAIFVRGRFMSPNAVQDRIMKQCCEEAGGVFVNMDTPALSGDPRNYAGAEKGITHYTDGAILAHPGDRGMKAIADALFDAMQVHGGLKKPAAVTADKTPTAGGTDKTLVSWVALADTAQRGGSALTIQRGEEFDAIVFGENEPGKWMAGSNHFVRTQRDQQANAVGKADDKTLVQMAIVYQGNQISIYRNGEPYASYQANNIDLLGPTDNMAVFGLRHRGGENSQTLQGSIEDGRIYDRALTAEEIRNLEPNKASEIKPYAWWTFEQGRETDAMGRFPVNSLGGGARIEGGRLVLPADGAMLIAAAQPLKIAAAAPTTPPLHYHAAGMYHWDTWFLPLDDAVHMYHLQVKRPGSARSNADHEAIGHAVSKDLIHWQEQPVALRKGPPGAYDDGCLFTAYAVEHQGTIYLYYCSNHGENGRVRQAICLATSTDAGRTYQKCAGNPIIEPDPNRYYAMPEPPAPFGHHAHPHIDCRDLAVVKDPAGNGWLGYVVMRRKGQQDAFHSACVALCRSKDLVQWEVGDPCCTPNRFNCFEVPDVFEINGKWYMIALTGDVYGQSQRWSDPEITCATVVFQADRPEGPFEEVKDNLLLASKRNVWQGFSARTVQRNGERLMFFTRCEGVNGRGRLSWPMRLVPRKEGGLDPMYWPGIDAAFGPATVLAREGQPLSDSAFMITATLELNDAKAAGIAFGTHLALLDSAGKVLLFDATENKVVQDRRWPVRPAGAYRLRLVVVDGMVDIYVDDVHVMDYYLANWDAGAGRISLESQGGSCRFIEPAYRAAQAVLAEAGATNHQRRTGYVHDTSINPFIVTGDGNGLGDPMPVCWDGVWHLYALSADLRTVPHFTSTDLVKWVEHKPAMTGRDIATGTVVRHDNTYYFFYTDGGPQTIRLVTSDNPWEFDFSKSRLVAEADGKTYRKGWFRDAYVVYNEEEKLWWMLFEGRCPEVCTGLFTSKDLLIWTQCDPIFKDKARAYGSCPQVLKHGGLWYLAIQDMGNCHYSAESAYGPWTDRGQYLSMMVEAASRFATDGRRQITWGWLCDWAVKPKKEIRSYGGPLCIGREMVFKKDGTMGVRAVPELSAAIRKAAHNVDLGSARMLSGQWKIDPGRRTLQSLGESGGKVLLALPEKNPDYYFEAELEFDSPRVSANIVLRASDTADRGYGFALSPASETIAIRDFFSATDGRVLDDKPYAFPGKNKVSLQIFVCDNHLEAFVDDQECLSARTVDRSCRNLAIEVAGGSATIRNPLLHYFSSTSRRSK